MSLDGDDEILQDFIIEASEIIEQLSEQLVDLETKPDDKELLNAIFRGFHTVKGGAGFLALNNLVDICHVSENVFDLLRQGKREVNANLMDVVLQALDSVTSMFGQIKALEEPSPADDSLLKALYDIVEDNPVEEDLDATKDPDIEEKVENQLHEDMTHIEEESEEMTEEEFEGMLDAIQGKGNLLPDVLHSHEQEGESKAEESKPEEKPAEPAKVIKGAGDDLITDDEFELLLDKMNEEKSDKKAEPAKEEVQEAKTEEVSTAYLANDESIFKSKNSGDLITEDEFEHLLDTLEQMKKPGGAEPKKQDNKPKVEVVLPKVEEKLKVTEAPKPAAAKPAEPKPAAAKPVESKPAAKPAAAKPVEVKPAESKPAAAKPAAKPPEKEVTTETTVRVDTSRLDEIMNMVGELVLVRNRLVKLKGNSADEEMAKAVSNLDVVTADLQMSVMKTRMQPIKKVFGRFPRVVRDLARSLKKDISLEMEGEETDLDKNLVEALSDPLVHLVRNSVDHGVEMPDDRVAAGKPKTGKILLSAEQAGDHILLCISDDGKGMDPDALRKRAIDKGIMDEDAANRLSDKECFNLIFMAGFSTKEEVSDISGRGVGMDVVKTKITQLNGVLEVESVKGQGSKILIKVPLTLAILPTLMIEVGKQVFALPLTGVNEIFHLDLSKTNIVDGQLVIIVRDKAIPLFYLNRWLCPREATSKNLREGYGHVVIVSVGTQRVGFVVDGLLGQEEVVIKALGDTLQGTAGMAGATITGDGKIALILDIPGLIGKYAVYDRNYA